MNRRSFFLRLSSLACGALAARALLAKPQTIPRAQVMPAYESDGPGKLPKAGEVAYFFDPHRSLRAPQDHPGAIGAFLGYDDARFEQGRFYVWARVVGRRGDWAVALIDQVDMQ